MLYEFLYGQNESKVESYDAVAVCRGMRLVPSHDTLGPTAFTLILGF